MILAKLTSEIRSLKNDMNIVVKKDNIPIVMTQYEAALTVAMEAIGIQAENYARDNCPVDTGRLKSSITHKTEKKKAIIGTNVYYAKYVEFIDRFHHNVGKAHFLRDAVSKHSREYKQIAEHYLKVLG